MLPTDLVKQEVEEAKKLLAKEFESEREHHQKLVKDYGRLQQRFENLHDEMKIMGSPPGIKIFLNL